MSTPETMPAKRMSRRNWIWAWSGVFALVHCGICLILSTAGWPSLLLFDATPRAGKLALLLLEFPFLAFASDSAMSAGTRALAITANSAAAGLILAFVWRFKERGRIERSWAGILLACALLAVPSHAQPQNARESTVGIPARITDIVLPGSELEVLPQTAKTAVVLRITRVAPHGSEFRYDLEWAGLDPGEHDLRAFLRRKDGTDMSGLPAVPVTVRSVLPPGQIVPHHPPAGDVPGFGGYRAWWIVGGILWTIGLVWILLGFRKQRQRDAAVEAPPRTLAERLRPLVERALDGRLSRTERAQLELGLVSYWRRKLGLDDRQPAEAHVILREHAQAGPLLNQLDAWLHKPGPHADVDVGALLAPYKNLPPDAIDVPDLVARRA